MNKWLSLLKRSIILGIFSAHFLALGQDFTDESFINYSKPNTYIIGGMSVSGTQYIDPSAIIAVTGFKVGDKVAIPGDAMTMALRKLWDQGILGDVKVQVTKISNDSIYFNFDLKERPRLSKFVFLGITKSEQDDLKEKIRLIKGRTITDVMVKNTQKKVKNFYAEKGFNNAKITMLQALDTTSTGANQATLRIVINKGRKVKVDEVTFLNNEQFSDRQLRKKLKNSKRMQLIDIPNVYFLDNKPLTIKLFRKKFIRNKYEEDKKSLTDFYNSEGYRDFNIVSDTVTLKEGRFANIKIKLDEGRKYYFRNIRWNGNYIYEDDYLNRVMGIKKGDVYNMSALEKRLNYNPTGADVSSLYLDDGYLFFNVEPQEVSIEGDSIDVDMKMYEGPQATINKINIAGNTKTNDHVILREIRTKPGQKFSRADLIRTQREIATLGYFDPEKIEINPKPNPANGTVDIDYGVAEKPSDQIELSGGWGGFYGFIGTLGLSFNNFSARNIFKLYKWSPLPSGDGQKLALRVQANGPSFQSYSISFSEPWLGGRKPTSLSVSASYSVSRLGQNVFGGLGGGFGGNTRNFLPTTNSKIGIINLSVSLGRRVRWPDDYFTLSHTIGYSRYNLDNYNFANVASVTSALNSVVITNTLSRNSIDNPMFPKRGSSFTLSLMATPPFSLFTNQDYSKFGTNEVQRLLDFKWVEYYKVMFDGSWFTNIAGKLVLNTRAHFGFLGRYNDRLGYSPFERFLLGGNGLSGFNFILGSDIIGMRGYANNQIGPTPFTNDPTKRDNGGLVYNKFVWELRYPISLSQAATVYVLAFAEGGNNWNQYADFNPLNIKKSVGFGARIFMPAFGLIGIDYGIPLNPDNAAQVQNFTFSIGQQIR